MTGFVVRVGLVASLAVCGSPALARAQAQDSAAGDSKPAPSSAAEAAATVQDEKLACAQSFETAQRLRNEVRYLAANGELLKCANPTCGDALFYECSKMYSELQAAIPSVVLAASDPKGNEMFDVQVTVDGEALVERLDGKPLPLDPGNHVFVFTAANAAPVEHRLVIRAGEKFRQVSVVIGSETQSTGPSALPQVTPTEPARVKPRQIPIMSYVLGGVGVVGIGGFVALRVIGSSDYDTLKNGCAPECPDSDVDAVKQKYTFSYVALGVGAASLVGAAVVYLAQPREYETAPSAALVFTPVPNGATAALVGRF